MDNERTMLRSLARGETKSTPTALGGKTDALVRIGALIALSAVPSVYEEAVRSAQAQGASEAEVVDTLLAVSGTVGMARVVLASEGLSCALGYDIDAALEGGITGAS